MREDGDNSSIPQHLKLFCSDRKKKQVKNINNYISKQFSKFDRISLNMILTRL